MGSLLPSLVLSFQDIFLGSVVVVKLSERADRWHFTALEKDPYSINHRSLGWSVNRRTFSLDSLETEGDRDSMSPLAFLGFQLTGNICASQCFTSFLTVQPQHGDK